MSERKVKAQATVEWLAAAVATAGDDCMEWPFHRNAAGYGRLRLGGGTGYTATATHVALEIDGRTRPTGAIALHSCDNPPCCNPRHLRWGTDAENAADRDARGRTARLAGQDVPSAKLTDAIVRDVRRRAADGETQRSIAKRYGVTHQAIGYIVRRVTWAHVPDERVAS